MAGRGCMDITIAIKNWTLLVKVILLALSWTEESASIKPCPKLGADMNVMVVAECLFQNLTSSLGSADKNAHNLRSITRELGRISRLVATDESVNFSGNVINHAVNVLSVITDWPEKELEHESSQIIRSVEDVYENLATHNALTKPLVVDLEHVDLVVHHKDAKSLRVSGISFTSPSDGDSVNASSIVLPRDVFENTTADMVGVVFSLYKTGSLFPLRVDNEARESPVYQTIGSPVIAASVANENITNLNAPITITLDIIIANATNPRCVSWNFDDAGGKGNWSNDGCSLESVAGNTVVCKCTHLTNFGLLVDINARLSHYKDDVPLRTISIICSIISMTGFVINVITLLIFRKIRQNGYFFIKVQKSISFFVMLFFFLVGIDYTESEFGCTLFSLLIQYFTMSSVAWMGIEALWLYLKLIIVFGDYSRRQRILLSIIGWASPGPFVIISLLTLTSGKNHLMSKGNYCFIGHPVIFFSVFMVPILLVIFINTLVFFLVLHVLTKHVKRKRKVKRNYSSYIHSVLYVANILGLHWWLGTFTIADASLTFQWLFVIFFTLQGFYYFITESVLFRDARDEWLGVVTACRHRLHCGPSTQHRTQSTLHRTHSTYRKPIRRRHAIRYPLSSYANDTNFQISSRPVDSPCVDQDDESIIQMATV